MAYYNDEEQLAQAWRQKAPNLVHKEQVLDMLNAFAGKERMRRMEELFMDDYVEEEPPFVGHGDIIEYLKRCGIRETIIKLLEELGTIPEELLKKIKDQDDAEKLDVWVKYLVKIGSIEEFAKLIDE